MSDSHGPGDGVSPPPPGGTPYSGAFNGDILATSGDEEPTRRVPWLVVAGVGVLVLALVGGVTYGVGALSGGGSQPESALPSGAVAYLKVDLDPSAGQKVDALPVHAQVPRAALEGRRATTCARSPSRPSPTRRAGPTTWTSTATSHRGWATGWRWRSTRRTARARRTASSTSFSPCSCVTRTRPAKGWRRSPTHRCKAFGRRTRPAS